MTAAPNLAAAKTYLGPSAAAYSDAQITGALGAETEAQLAKCKIPLDDNDVLDYPDDLHEALLRRVARNLAMRGVPLGVQPDEGGGIRIGMSDPEVRRLEGPHRRMKVG